MLYKTKYSRNLDDRERIHIAINTKNVLNLHLDKKCEMREGEAVSVENVFEEVKNSFDDEVASLLETVRELAVS